MQPALFTMATSDPDQFSSCIRNWVTQQEKDLDELVKGSKEDTENEVKLRLLVETNVKHFEEYCENRATLAKEDAPFFFCPTLCSSFENSYSWLAGSRPSLFIRLVYMLSCSQLESHLDAYLQGERGGDLGGLSAMQLTYVNELQCKMIKDEEKLSTMMASLQENIADSPVALMAYQLQHPSEADDNVNRAIDASALALSSILQEADKLRVRSLKEMIKILTPLQAVDFLKANIKLNLSIHEWGKRRDHRLQR